MESSHKDKSDLNLKMKIIVRYGILMLRQHYRNILEHEVFILRDFGIDDTKLIFMLIKIINGV